MSGDIMQAIREAYPFASLDKALLHAEALHSKLPFGALGPSGGYGWKRLALVRAILSHDWVAAETAYYELHLDGLEDALAEGQIESLEAGLAESLQYMDGYGNISIGD